MNCYFQLCQKEELKGMTLSLVWNNLFSTVRQIRPAFRHASLRFHLLPQNEFNIWRWPQYLLVMSQVFRYAYTNTFPNSDMGEVNRPAMSFPHRHVTVDNTLRVACHASLSRSWHIYISLLWYSLQHHVFLCTWIAVICWWNSNEFGSMICNTLIPLSNQISLAALWQIE